MPIFLVPPPPARVRTRSPEPPGARRGPQRRAQGAAAVCRWVPG